MSAPVDCPGCGLQAPQDPAVPAHPYIGASPGCYACFTQVLADDFTGRASRSDHNLFVDAYAAQHPGTEGDKQAQSVTVHLCGLCMALERNADPDATRRLLQRMTDVRPFTWLAPPELTGTVSVTTLVGQGDNLERTALVDAYAQSVWHAWVDHHDHIRRLVADHA